MIRRLALLLAALILPAASAHASALGEFAGARPIPVNGRLFGAYLQASENTFGVLAQLRLSFYPGLDFGFQGGLTRLNYVGGDRTTLRVGTDLKFIVLQAGERSPVDVSIGGALGIVNGDSYNILTVGPSAVASRTYPFSTASSVTPYVGLGILFSRIDIGAANDTDVSLPLRVGATLSAIPGVDLMGEIEFRLSDVINDNTGFALGANVPF